MSEPASSSLSETPAVSERVRIVVCTPNPASPPVIAALVKQMQAQQSVDFERVEKPDELMPSVSKSTQGVVICTLNEKEELLGILNFLAKCESRILENTLRVMIISRMNHPKVNAILRSKGVAEILEYQVTIKALNLKIKNALLIVHQSRLKSKKGVKDRGTMAELNAGSARPRADQPGEVIWDKPVEHPCDFWILTNKKNVRFVMGRWLIDVFGPGPSAGTWESSEIQYKGEVGWEWRPRVSTDPTFQRESGKWVFFGRVPEFVWAKNSWAFVGKFARLAFYRDGEALFDRFTPDANAPGKLRILENSENAKSMTAAIQATLEASVKLSNDGDLGGMAMPGTNEGQSGSVSGEPHRTRSEVDESARSRGGRARAGSSSQSMMMDPSFLSRRADVQALSFMKPASAEAQGSWNDHLGATGVNFNAKNHRMPERGVSGKWGGSNLLTPNETGLDMGFADLDAVGIKIDRSAFESIDFKVRITAKNKSPFAKPELISVLDLTGGEALFDAPANIAKVGDELAIEALLTIADRRTKVDLIGFAYKSENFEDGRSLLICKFTNEYAEQFAAILKVFQDRQIELSHFFRMAKGA